MPQSFYRELTDLLRADGCYFKKDASGSHEKWFSPRTGKVLIVFYTIKSRHTANGILKDAGLPKAF